MHSAKMETEREVNRKMSRSAAGAPAGGGAAMLVKCYAYQHHFSPVAGLTLTLIGYSVLV